MKVFNLPDLGEGLPDAEIVEWKVSEGDAIKVDEPLVAMETAKAVVDVPSPYTGKVVKLYGQPGDVINTGDPLCGFEVEGEVGEDDSSGGGEAPAAEAREETAREDSGTVVGAVDTSDRVVEDQATPVAGTSGVRATPAVRALAKKLGVDLSQVPPTGKNGNITSKDVKQFAEQGPAAPARAASAQKPAQQQTPAPAAAHPPKGDWQPIRGTRRAMLQSMAKSHAEVAATTLTDDADLHAWQGRQDITVRVVRALCSAARAEPSLNAWLDADNSQRKLFEQVDVGIAVDTEDGLFVPALRNANHRSPEDLRRGIEGIRQGVKDRSIPPEELKDYTIMLSNFGVFAGRYATPMINPPCVAILATGKLRADVVPVLGGVEVHRVMPLSLTFDHRAVTGGEAARFLAALIEDLQQPA